MHDIRSVLGAEIWNYSIFYKVKILSLIKYPIQAIKTFIKLVKSKPNTIIVQNPPIFAALTCLIYSTFHRVKIIVDHHFIWSMSGFIKNPAVRSFVNSIEKFCVRKADLNTTYTEYWEHRLITMGAGNVLTVYDFVDKTWLNDADRSVREKLPKDKKIIVMPCGGGHTLERPDLLIEASKDINVIVIITGEKKHLQKHIMRAHELRAENVIFTDFLSDRQYRGLIATCDFVSNISDEPYGIPHVISEALASGRSIIVSNNPAIEKLLGDDYPLILSRNDVNTIRNTILLASKRQKQYVKLATKLYEKLKEKREKQLKRLFEHVYGCNIVRNEAIQVN